VPYKQYQLLNLMKLWPVQNFARELNAFISSSCWESKTERK